MTPSPDECAQFCHKLPSADLVGFVYDANLLQGFCSCLYSGQNLPTPPSGLRWVGIANSDNGGTGPIRGTDAGLPGDCYAFAQVRKSTSFHLSRLSFLNKYIF